jgi:hypothetical protein
MAGLLLLVATCLDTIKQTRHASAREKAMSSTKIATNWIGSYQQSFGASPAAPCQTRSALEPMRFGLEPEEAAFGSLLRLGGDGASSDQDPVGRRPGQDRGVVVREVPADANDPEVVPSHWREGGPITLVSDTRRRRACEHRLGDRLGTGLTRRMTSSSGWLGNTPSFALTRRSAATSPKLLTPPEPPAR